MSKQTALDWYWDKIKSHFEHDGDLLETASFTFAIAKQKEREQMLKLISFVRMHNKMGKSAEDLLQEFETYKKSEQ